MGALIVLALGVIVGIGFHRVSRRFWVACASAALVAAITWGGGCYLLFALTAPSELAPPLLIPVLLTIGTAFVGAVAGGGISRAVQAR